MSGTQCGGCLQEERGQDTCSVARDIYCVPLTGTGRALSRATCVERRNRRYTWFFEINIILFSDFFFLLNLINTYNRIRNRHLTLRSLGVRVFRIRLTVLSHRMQPEKDLLLFRPFSQIIWTPGHNWKFNIQTSPLHTTTNSKSCLTYLISS